MSICLPSAHTHTATPFSPLGCVGCPSQCVCSACVVVVKKYTSGTPSRAVPAQSRPSRPVPEIGGSVPDLQLFPFRSGRMTGTTDGTLGTSTQSLSGTMLVAGHGARDARRQSFVARSALAPSSQRICSPCLATTMAPASAACPAFWLSLAASTASSSISRMRWQLVLIRRVCPHMLPERTMRLLSAAAPPSRGRLGKAGSIAIAST